MNNFQRFTLLLVSLLSTLSFLPLEAQNIPYKDLLKKADAFILSNQSDSARAYYLLCESSVNAGNLAATQYLRKQITATWLQQKQYQKALAYVDTLIQKSESENANRQAQAYLYFLRAQVWYRSENAFALTSWMNVPKNRKQLVRLEKADQTRMYFYWSEALQLIGKHDSSNVLVKKAESLISFIPRKNQEYFLFQLTRLRIINFLEIGAFKEAEQAISQLVMQSDKSRPVAAYQTYFRGLVARYRGDYKSAYLTHKGLMLSLAKSKDTLDAAEIIMLNYSEYAYALDKIGKFNEALDIGLKAQNSFASYYGEEHPRNSQVFIVLSEIYLDKSDVGKAIEYLQRSKVLRENFYGPNSILASECYQLQAYIQLLKNESKDAFDNANRSFAIRNKLLPHNHLYVAEAINARGLAFKQQQQLDSASANLLEAMAIYKALNIEPNHVFFARLYNDLGTVLQDKEKFNSSIEDYLSSLKIYRKLLGEVHPDLAMGYYNVAGLYRVIKSYPAMIKYYQKSMAANVPGFEDTTYNASPSIKSVLSDYILLLSLSDKAIALEEWVDEDIKNGMSAESDSVFRRLVVSLNTFTTCVELVDKLRTGYASDESKVFISQKTSYIYEKAILLCIRLYNLKKDPKYQEYAFLFSEKNKMGTLLSSINEANALKVSGVPDSLLIYERNLLAKIKDKDKALFDELKKGIRADSALIDMHKKQLLSLKTDYSTFIHQLETDYPRFYQLKYNSTVYSIKDIQAVLLNKNKKKKNAKNATMLEYFVGNKNIYIFCISQDRYDLTVVPKDSQFTGQIKAVRNAIKFKMDDLYVEYASALHRQLFLPVENKITTQEILIIPDGLMALLPFEALVPELATKKVEGQYKKVPYLLKKYSFHYMYSANLAVELHRQKNYTTKYGLLAIAPGFSQKKSQGEYQTSFSKKEEAPEFNIGQYPYDSLVSKKQVSYIPETLKEAKSIYTVFKRTNSHLYLNQYAQELILNSPQLKEYRYIHLATHGFVNTSRPEYSGIYFADPCNKEGDGIWHNSEIYSSELGADLVTLSACETGVGQIANGEGIIGIPRSLFYAGSKNVLVSLWKVSDASTSELMNSFYKKIRSNKMTMSEALAKAKKKLLKKEKFSAPYYWASFILIGSTSEK